MSRNPINNTPPQGRTIAVVGDVYRFLATGDDTSGKYPLFEALVGPGGGPPPHVQSREEEGFYVLEGKITFTANGERVVATAWMFANMPVGTPHSFKSESDRPAKIVNGADTDNALWQQPESAGLNAVAEGFRHLGFKDNHELNAAEWIVYDALYAYCREMVRRGKPDGAFW